MNHIDLEGKAAVVTGGGQGIGRSIAKRLTVSGARVVIWDIDDAIAEATAAEIPGTQAIVTDVARWDAVQAAFAETERSLGKVDILVNSAGIAGSNATVEDYDVAEWQKIVEINLNGTFYANKIVVPGMRARNYGRIVNIASVAGKEGNPNAAAYSASKAGVIGLTKSLGKELAGQNIAVNCITPAAAKTRIFDQMSEEHINYMLAKIPRGRFLELDEAAALVTWLVSAENSFTTGAVFDLSGGRATY